MKRLLFYKLSFLIIVIIFISCAGILKTSEKKSLDNKTNSIISNHLPWSTKMVLSEIHRFPDPTLLDFRKQPKWSYTNGLVLQAMFQVYRLNKDKKIYDYIYDYGNRMIEADGQIKTYKFSDYNLDMIKSGDAIFDLYQETKEDRFKKAMEILVQQLHEQPTTSEGGYWHKKIYPYQLWLDGVYMAEPFSAKYAISFLNKQQQKKAFDKIILQFDLFEKHNKDPKTGLYYHGWDESKNEAWANKETGLSQHFWSRGIGWYGMALVDVLEILPNEYEGRIKLLQYLQNYVNAVIKVQDQKSGLWYQILDQPQKKGNYLESSGSSMFVYTISKAVRKGYIPRKYLSYAKKGYQGIISNLISVESNGIININQACSVAGLGGKPYRDGSYEYYINEPIRSNDPKATGPFIMASLEIEKL